VLQEELLLQLFDHKMLFCHKMLLLQLFVRPQGAQKMCHSGAPNNDPNLTLPNASLAALIMLRDCAAKIIFQAFSGQYTGALARWEKIFPASIQAQ